MDGGVEEVRFTLGLKQKVLLIWLCFSSVTSLLVVVLIQPNIFAESLRIFASIWVLLNLPAWAAVFVWHLLKQAHANLLNTFVLCALLVNYVTAFVVWSAWKNHYAAYFILIVTSVLAAMVLNDISKTIVFGGLSVIVSALSSAILMLLPLLVYGAPVEQVNVGLVIYVGDTLWKLVIVLPLCMLAGLVVSFLHDWISNRQNAELVSK